MEPFGNLFVESVGGEEEDMVMIQSSNWWVRGCAMLIHDKGGART